MRRNLILVLTLLSSLTSSATLDNDQPLTGYSTEGTRVERDWEGKFRAIPSPDNQRDYMKRLSARPHHVGSPYDKDNAEWLLAKMKEWGLDAHIENFDVLFPTPKERIVDPRTSSNHLPENQLVDAQIQNAGKTGSMRCSERGKKGDVPKRKITSAK